MEVRGPNAIDMLTNLTPRPLQVLRTRVRKRPLCPAVILVHRGTRCGTRTPRHQMLCRESAIRGPREHRSPRGFKGSPTRVDLHGGHGVLTIDLPSHTVHVTQSTDHTVCSLTRHGSGTPSLPPTATWRRARRRVAALRWCAGAHQHRTRRGGGSARSPSARS